jgi:predicted lipoprotein with Yx(FWY)xxD motif
MNRILGAVAACIAFAAILAACGGNDDEQDTSAPSATGGPTAAMRDASKEERSSGRSSRRGGASVKVMRSRYGRVVFDGRGRALYLFTRDRTSRSRCYGDCATAWPPFLTSGEPRARGAARSRLLGTTRRRDGKAQVTYRGQPLYYYVGDRKPGQILCQDVVEFGGTWLVVSPSGRAVR